MRAGEAVALVEVGSPDWHHAGEHAAPDQALAVVACVALAGGPLDGWWFTLADLEAHCTAALRMGHTAADQAGAVLGYRPTGRAFHPTGLTIPRGAQQGLDAEVWEWTGRAAVRHLSELADPRGRYGVSCPVVDPAADSVVANVQDDAQREVGRRAACVDDPRGSEAGRSVTLVGCAVGAGWSPAGVHRESRVGGAEGNRADRCAGAGGARDGVRGDSECGRGDYAPGGTDAGRAGAGVGRCGGAGDSGPYGDRVDQHEEHGEREGCLDVGHKETTPSPGQRLGVDRVIGAEGQLRGRTNPHGQETDRSPAERLAR